MKTVVSIKDLNAFRMEADTGKAVYGCDQDWYGKRWQRMAGCGPSTVANMIYYLYRAQGQVGGRQVRSELQRLMDEIWDYVTPGMGGVSSTGMLMDGVRGYLADRRLIARLYSVDIEKKQERRPDLEQVVSFLEEGLAGDTPVAFLNLDHGSIANLESWHWVTAVGLEYDLKEPFVSLLLMDNGTLKQVDLISWLDTTKLGGGFVRLEPEKDGIR